MVRVAGTFVAFVAGSLFAMLVLMAQTLRDPVAACAFALAAALSFVLWHQSRAPLRR